MKNLHVTYTLPVAIMRENKRFVAYTPALDLSTSGRTFKEAQKRFIEASTLFFEELVRKGTADSVLSELGWKKVKKKWQPPVVVSQQIETVTVAA